MTLFDRSYMISYLCSVVTVWHCFDIFDFEKCRDLEICFQDHSWSSKLAPVTFLHCRKLESLDYYSTLRSMHRPRHFAVKFIFNKRQQT